MKGFVLTIIMENDLFMLEFFKCFRLGIAKMNNASGIASSLILGIWKIETNITLVWRKNMEWHEIGEA